MLSIIIPARNSQQLTAACLDALLVTVHSLGLVERVEYVLIDDFSDEKHEIQGIFGEFLEVCGSRCTIERLPEWSHYTGSFARGMELATGDNLFLLSNDMQITPDFLRTVLAVASLDSSVGIVRGTSRFCDSHPIYNTQPTNYPRNYAEVCAFSRYVADYHGLTYQIDPLLSGDAVLVKRAVVDAIGVMDTRFFGYFGDVDYGVRARRAGFALACAMGAWLHHEGGGHVKQAMQDAGQTAVEARTDRLSLVSAAYQVFRAKWGEWMPPDFDVNAHLHQLIDFDRLVREGPVTA